MESVYVTKDAISRSFSHVPPAHFLLKIQTFSSLLENNVENYDSLEFHAGGHKWKIVVYPNGNKKKNVKDHISLHLAIADDTSSLGFCWEVYAIFRLFLLNQNRDKFLILQDAVGKERRFHGMKLEWGFDEFIPLEEFKNASNGYLVGDTCVFGAEVFVKEKNIGIGECLSMKKLTSASIGKHVWKIKNFSQMEAKRYNSELFVAGDQKWQIELYPKGNGSGTGSHLSMYLKLGDSSTINSGFKIYVQFTLQIQDQVTLEYHKHEKTSVWFRTSIPNWGWSKFAELSDLNKAGNGFIVNDVCIVEAEVSVLGVSKSL